MKPFQREKMKSLVLHILATGEPGQFTAAAMNLILFLADVLHLGSAGETISGETYLRGRSGPVAKHLATIRALLIAEAVIGEQMVETEAGHRVATWFVRRNSDRQSEIQPLSARELKALTRAIEHNFGVDHSDAAPLVEAFHAADAIDLGEPINLNVALLRSSLPAAA